MYTDAFGLSPQHESPSFLLCTAAPTDVSSYDPSVNKKMWPFYLFFRPSHFFRYFSLVVVSFLRLARSRLTSGWFTNQGGIFGNGSSSMWSVLGCASVISFWNPILKGGVDKVC